MGDIIILEETSKNPITLIGKRAGVCWNGDITDNEKNYKRGMDCILSNHGRTLEYVNVELVIDGYSARVIREWYTHIGGSPTRLQASTRYVGYNNFNYVTPNTICNNKKALDVYTKCMNAIKVACKELEEIGVPREDAALLLPLGMTTKIVDKRNLRNLVDMSRQRKCMRAYWEYRELFADIEKALKDYSEEWAWIVDNLFKRKCDELGYCPEKKSCGYKKNKRMERFYMKRKNNKNKEVEEFIIEKAIDNAVLVSLKYVPIKRCKRDYTRFYLYDVYKYDTLTNKSVLLYRTCLDTMQKKELIEDAKNSVDRYLESHN